MGFGGTRQSFVFLVAFAEQQVPVGSHSLAGESGNGVSCGNKGCDLLGFILLMGLHTLPSFQGVL